MKQKPIRKKKFQWNPENIFVADFETTTNNTKWYDNQLKKNNAELVRITYWYMKNLTGTKEYEGTNIESFVKKLHEIRTRHLQLYFHNLAFDGDFIYYYLSKVEPNKYVGLHYKNDEFILDGWEIEEQPNCRYFRVKKGWYNLFQSGSKIMNITIGSTDKNHYKTISINCSLRLLSAPVSALAISYGFSKMTNEDLAKGMSFYDVEPDDDLERFKANNKNYVEYCKRDVEAVRLSIIDFKATIDDLPYVKEKNLENDRTRGLNIAQHPTIASLSRDLMENIFIKGFQYGYFTELQSDGTYKLVMNENKPAVNVNQMMKYRKDNKQNLIREDGTMLEQPIGSMAKISMETHQIFSENHYYTDDEGIGKDDIYDRYYKGGLTQFNPHYFDWKDIGRACKLDVSSAYPYHMTKPLPYGAWIDEKDFWDNHYKEGWKEGVDYIEFVKVYCKSVEPYDMNDHCCVLPNWTNAKVDGFNKLYRKNPNRQENFIVCTTKAEWDELQHWGKFEIEQWPDAKGKLNPRIERNYMYAAPYLKDMMNILYNLKDYYSKTKQTGKKQSIKILLNSTYGSMALRTEYDTIYYVNKSNVDLLEPQSKHLVLNTQFENYKEYSVKGFSPSRDFNNQIAVKMAYEKEKATGFNKAAAAVITSYERVYLMETIRKIGATNFGYCDTDSILFVNLNSEQIKQLKALSDSRKGLGSWEFEDTYLVNFKAVGAKKYKTKSIPCIINDDGTDTFYNLDNEGNKIYFDNATEAINYAARNNKFHINNKIAGITQTNENDTVLDLDANELKDKDKFIETMLKIFDKQDEVYKDKNPLSLDTINTWYDNYINNGIVPIIAGNKTAIRVLGGRLILTTEKQLQLNSLFT